MNNIKVTIIVAVYNVLGFLPKCADTVFAQTMPDSELEILFVDDCSTDGSYEYLQERADSSRAARTNVRVLQTPRNSGNGALPRNTGIEAARGEYLLILDGDDYFDPRFAEKTYARAKLRDADIVSARYHRRIDGKPSQMDTATSWYEIFISTARGELATPAERAKAVFVSDCTCWTKLFRREFIMKSGLRFLPITCHDDLFFSMATTITAERICGIPDKLVYYNQGVGQEARTDQAVKLDGMYKNLEAFRDFFEARPELAAYKKGAYFHLCQMILKNNGFTDVLKPGCLLTEELYDTVCGRIFADFGIPGMFAYECPELSELAKLSFASYRDKVRAGEFDDGACIDIEVGYRLAESFAREYVPVAYPDTQP
ncbi:hypothetical protein FACS1894133_4870 [Clostridia bacterium]|nr:hypothetical protein FACS1894133_4870 [Clostridia bacterium]